MAADPGITLHAAKIERVLPFRDNAAVVLSAGGKKFMIFVGMYEATALIREIRGDRPDRPLTHDVVAYVLAGFDIRVKKVVISSIVSSVFCGTLVLEQATAAGLNEVRLDIRASDSLVLALKTKTEIWVTRRVLDSVEDVTETLVQIDEQLADGQESDEGDDDDPEVSSEKPEEGPPDPKSS